MNGDDKYEVNMIGSFGKPAERLKRKPSPTKKAGSHEKPVAIRVSCLKSVVTIVPLGG